ncbi:PLP-dependent aminotransferase family protein [Amycolatopsis acidicola]|uniref:PLP-dependent aminotransferase family protein n=1 Tax=Amycolatopsis acidicola TaxID=2596893 RepID=A0A5N0UUT9_9PSEU|nr:PLP-dependent aminotransferase family protein [Amycolatopsis acidicola]KAA9154195.1 PLP-dependent aminotransferase family protein [Amycolatopsis acidicola]
MDDYRAIADALADDVRSGQLRPGDRLPPQRRFARERGIANSTAARVYAELVRRGLAVGETGRGTFIRAGAPRPEPALAEPARGIDLELNFPVLPEKSQLVADTLAPLLRSDALTSVLRPVVDQNATREIAAKHLSRGGWSPDPRELVLTGNGRQAIAAAIAALVPAGERLGVEELTYPVVKGIAARLGVTLVPLAMDSDGVLPAAIADAARLRAVYLQPSLHNPLGVTMSRRRRAEIVETVAAQGSYLIDDGINGFLADDLAPLASERTLVLDSLSKRLAPGLTLGFVAAPPALTAQVATAVRSGGWAPAHFAVEAATRLMSTGALAEIEAAKRQDAKARQEIVRARLAVRSDPRSYHCWWELPEPWRAETFVAAAARRGIAVTPAAAFAVGSGRAPSAVRLALASPPVEVLAGALDVLAGLARSSPEDAGVE